MFTSGLFHLLTYTPCYILPYITASPHRVEEWKCLHIYLHDAEKKDAGELVLFSLVVHRTSRLCGWTMRKWGSSIGSWFLLFHLHCLLIEKELGFVFITLLCVSEVGFNTHTIKVGVINISIN